MIPRPVAKEITEQMNLWIRQNSGHQEHRDYIGLSGACLSVEEILRNRCQGFPNPNPGKMYKGYQMEADLIRRLEVIFGNRIQPGGEIVAFGGQVKGHPDFLFDGDPGECKSVVLDEHLPEPVRLPRRTFWQMQGYMLYKPAHHSVVIYESRESGVIRAFDVFPVRSVQDEIYQKLATALEILASTPSCKRSEVTTNQKGDS